METYCPNYFSVVLTKHHGQGNSIEGKVFCFQFQRTMTIVTRSMTAGKPGWRWSSSWELTLWLISWKRLQGIVWAFETLKSTPLSPLPQENLSPNPCQTVLPNGDQAFKYMNVWWPFLFRLPVFISNSEMGCLCFSGWLSPCYIAKDILELFIFLPLPL